MKEKKQKLFTWISDLLTSMYNQLSVAKAIAKRATAMMEVIVAKLRVTAEQGIVIRQFPTNHKEITLQTQTSALRSLVTRLFRCWMSPGHVIGFKEGRNATTKRSEFAYCSANTLKVDLRAQMALEEAKAKNRFPALLLLPAREQCRAGLALYYYSGSRIQSLRLYNSLANTCLIIFFIFDNFIQKKVPTIRCFSNWSVHEFVGFCENWEV